MLVILTTHPIQYQVPLWQALARDGRVSFEVWYLTKHAAEISRDREFGKTFAWDLEMLSGYPHRFLDVDSDATPNTFWTCRFHGDFADELRRVKSKAVWIQGWQVAAYWQAAWAARKTGTEVWLRGESNDLASTPIWKRAIKRAVLGQLFRRVDRFLYIGRANKRLYEKFGVPQERLYSAPYAVDNDRFARQANEIQNSKFEIRKQWKIPEDAFCVLFCGKFISKKRPLDLIAAAQHLITDNRLTNLHLLFVGSGELGSQLRAKCNVVFDQENPSPTSDFRPPTSGTKPSASFAGFLNQTEISRAYVAADCLALPSGQRETWGLVVNEAMASGLPCIISDQCGCAEDLGRFSSNETFRSGNIRAFAEEIIALSTGSHPESSRVEFWNAYSFENTVDTTVQLYQGIARDDGSL